MKFRIIFIDNRVTLIFLADTVASSIDPIELTPADNTLEPIKRHLAGRDFKLTADASQCSLKLVDSNAFRASFEITANPDNSDPKTKIIAFLKILIHDLKDEKLLSDELYKEINYRIDLESAREYCSQASSEYVISKEDSFGMNTFVIKDQMTALLNEADKPDLPKERLSSIVADLQTWKDDYETVKKNHEREFKDESVPVGDLLTSIRKMLTEIKKFIHHKLTVTLKRSIYDDEAYNFLDQIGPKNCSGPPDYTPLDQAIPVHKTMSPTLKSVNNTTGEDKMRMLISLIRADESYRNDPEMLAAFDACIELVKLYDRLYQKSEKEQIKNNKRLNSPVNCPVTQFQTKENFQDVKDWAYALRLRGSLSSLQNKSAEDDKAPKEKHSKEALATKPVSSTPHRPLPATDNVKKKAPKEDSTTPLLAGEKPALSESDNPSFAKRHPWVVKLAKAGAFIFGALAFVSFFVPVPGLNLTLAGVFSAISAACGTVAAGIAAGTAAVVAITGGTVAVGAGVGAASGKLLECTPCCNPSNNAKMHKYLGATAFSVNSDNNLGPYVSLPPSTEYEEEESTAAYSPMPDRPMPAEEKRSAHLGATVKRL